MMKSFLSALRLLAVLTVITGAFYPAFMLMVGETFFPSQAHGSLLYQGEKIIGSALLAQKFDKLDVFHGLPRHAAAPPARSRCRGRCASDQGRVGRSQCHSGMSAATITSGSEINDPIDVTVVMVLRAP